MPVMCSLFQLSNRMCSLWLSSAKMLCSLWQLPVFLIPDMCSLFWFSKMLCSLWLFSHQFVCSLWKFAVFAILCSLFLFSCVRYGRHPSKQQCRSDFTEIFFQNFASNSNFPKKLRKSDDVFFLVKNRFFELFINKKYHRFYRLCLEKWSFGRDTHCVKISWSVTIRRKRRAPVWKAKCIHYRSK